jgi:rhamnosyltransferase
MSYNRILFYRHFNKKNLLSEHVVYQIKKLSEIYDYIVFISVSRLGNEDKERLAVSRFIEQDYTDSSFCTYRDAFSEFGFDKLKAASSVTIMSDACFGPLFDFKNFVDKMEADDEVDFWGITNKFVNSERDIYSDDRRAEIISSPKYIQTYFLTFKRVVVCNVVFETFWKNIKEPLVRSGEEKTISAFARGNLPKKKRLGTEQKNEIELTTTLEQAGFRSGTLMDVSNMTNEDIKVKDFDYSLFGLHVLIEERIPFLKVKGFVSDERVSLIKLVVDEIERVSNYPTELIFNYLQYYERPDLLFLLPYKYRDYASCGLNEVPQAKPNDKSRRNKVGIHLHVYYVDMVDEYLELFERYIVEYDLYITTDSKDKKGEITNIIKSNSSCVADKICEVLVTAQKGRDVLPWFAVKDKLGNYEIAGHFHTKKSPHVHDLVSRSWKNDLIKSLIVPAKSIFDDFYANNDLGLVIADVPTMFAFRGGLLFSTEVGMESFMKKLVDKIPFDTTNKIDIDFENKLYYLMSIGMMLWYRPGALWNLLEADIDNEVPDEPLPTMTILHAFERLPIYICCANGWDYRISKVGNEPRWAYIDTTNDVLRDVLIEMNGIKSSRSYRAGRVVLAPLIVGKKIYTKVFNKKRRVNR